MAVVNNGTKISVPSALLPGTLVAPAVTEFSDHEYKRELVLSVLKSTVNVADKSTTILNIIQNAVIGIEKQVLDIVTADYVGTNSVTFWIDWTALSSNVSVSVSSEFLSNTPINYVAKVIVYIKTN